MGEFAPGTVFAGHRIEAVAGRGGMGVVYRATHLALDRTVALKVIAPALIEDAPTRQRFLRESKIAASIDHPNVIPVYYTGEEDGVAYIAMRYVEGQDLRSLLRAEGPLDPVRAARIVSQVAAALDSAHAASLVHRDVKPANVLLASAEHVYLSDFGLSKHTLSVGGETRSGQWVGTLDYVAPEQIRGERLDARADVYALGCVLYFALTACAPYPRDGDEARMWAHLSEPPPAPSDVIGGLPPGLDGVVARALAKQPADRYPSAGDLGRAAVAAAAHDEVREHERVVGVGAAAPDETPTESASAPTAVQRPARRRRPPRAAIGAGLTAVAVAAVAALALTIGGEDARDKNSDTTKSGSPTPAPTPAVVKVGPRPNSIVVGDGTVFVTGVRDKRVTLIDEKSAKPRRKRPTVGAGGLDSAAGLGAVWVAVNRERAVFKLDPASGRRLARIALPMEPHTVAAGRGAVWVGMQTADEAAPDVLARIDPRTLRISGRIPIKEGIRKVVVTPRACGSSTAGRPRSRDSTRRRRSSRGGSRSATRGWAMPHTAPAPSG